MTENLLDFIQSSAIVDQETGELMPQIMQT